MLYTIHGWGFSKEIWKHAGLNNARHIELPGHGNSPHTETDIIKLSEKLAEFIPESATLLGWSLGATIACLIASNKNLRELVLVAPTTSFSGISQPETVVKKFLRDAKRNFEETIYRFRNLCITNKNLKLEIDLPKKDLALDLLKNFCYFNLTPHLQKITSRTRIIVGDKDQITKVSGAFRTFKEIKGCELLIKPREDHFPFVKSITRT